MSEALNWQGHQGSNPGPAVLETAALPTELYPSSETCPYLITLCLPQIVSVLELQIISGFILLYSIISATTPAPTVRPPSRMANRNPSSIAIGAIRFTIMEILSPGIIISVPSGNSTVPVTSVVRK